MIAYLYISLLLMVIGIVSFCIKRDLFSKFMSINLMFSGIFLLVLSLSKTIGYFSFQHFLILVLVVFCVYSTVGISMLSKFKDDKANLDLDSMDYDNE